MAQATAPRGESEGQRDTHTLVDHFRRQVAERGAAPALYHRAAGRYRPITWSDFARASLRLASFLVSEGVQEQDHVAIWADNRPEWHIADMAILSLRARPVPVYQTLSAEQAGYVLKHSQTKVVVVEAGMLERVLQADQTTGLHELRRVVVITDSDQPVTGNSMVISWQDALARGDDSQPDTAQEIDRRSRGVTPDDIATLIYTSGTTGPPKAVLLTHANVAAAVDALDEFVPGGPDERVVSYLPLAHIAERFSTEFRSYVYGNPVWFVDGIANLGDRLREVRPTQFFAVPRVWEKMADTLRKGVSELHGLSGWMARRTLASSLRSVHDDMSRQPPRPRMAERTVLRRLRERTGLDQAKILASGAAPIAPDVLRYFRAIGFEILEVYGQTEDTGLTAMNRPGHSRIGTVGTAFRGNQLRLAEDGEILVRGGVVFQGYYREDEATGETLSDGWLHTGDIGEIDADGFLRITDRKKDLIITAGGKNISPSHIEGLLQQHELIVHAVAIGDRRPFVAALLTLDPDAGEAWAKSHGVSSDDAGALMGNDELLAEIRMHVDSVNQHLAQVEQVKAWRLLPRDFEVGEELTPTMKVKRKVVAERYAGEIDGMYSKPK